MPSAAAFYRWTELDRSSWPAFRDAAGEAAEGLEVRPRSHPGPRTALPKPRARRLTPLDRALASRRSARKLSTAPLSDRELGHLLWFAHGAMESGGRGPVPSAGGLQALELYLVRFGDGAFHYDRAKHALTRLGDAKERADWRARVPSLDLVEGGSLLWVIAGDVERVEPKYGARGLRFLLLEAGHLMQNLCLLSASLKRTTVPLGAFFEKDVAAALGLEKTDLALYAGLCG
jgi:SagB-type dehydrogenase family enzyme